MTTVYPAVTSNGAVTSFVPLTTTFTPSTGCSEYFRLNGPSLVAFDPGYGLDIDTNVRCLPSAVTTWWEQGRLGGDDEGHTAISLGPLVCPDEWRTVASSIDDQSSTLAMCCPSGYYLKNGIPGSVVGDCLSDVSAGMVLTYASTSTDNSDVWHTETTSLTRSSTVGAIAIVGWNIELTIPTPTPTSTTSTPSSSVSTLNIISTPNVFPASSSSPSSPSSLSSPSPTATSNTSSNISPGVATGIGVGVGLGVIGVTSLLVALYLMRRRKRKRLANAPQTHQEDGGIMFAQPPPQDFRDGAPTKYELYDPNTGRPELYGGISEFRPIAELHE